MEDIPENDDFFDGEIKEKIEDQLKEPDMYRVLLHNDHYTTMDFVIEVLIKVFHKNIEDATRIMLDVHKKGKGMVGVFSYDIAKTKVSLVNQMSKSKEFPLKCTYESI